MEIKTHTINNTKIAEVIADDIVLKANEDGLDLLGNLYYHVFNKINYHLILKFIILNPSF